MKGEFYAHSRDGTPPEEWHRLEDHLKKVAEIARSFGNEFNAGDWAYLAGVWHDLGKYAPAFQNKLRAAAGNEAHLEAKARVDPSTAGGLNAVQRFGKAGR